MSNQYATSAGMRRGEVVTLKASGAETSSTVGGAVELSSGGNAMVTVKVTAVSGGTPTLTVAVQGSVDGSSWVTLGVIGSSGYSVGSATAPSSLTTTATAKGVYPALPFLRTSSTIGGTTPSFTYSVTAAVG